MSDLVERLNAWADNWKTLMPPEVRTYLKEAASRIIALEEENKRLRDAAAKYRDVTLKYFSDTDYDRNGALAEADAELFNILFEADRRARKEIDVAHKIAR